MKSLISLLQRDRKAPPQHPTRTGRSFIISAALLGLVAGFGLSACNPTTDQRDMPRYKPLAESNFFADKASARPLLKGVVAWGPVSPDSPEASGKDENGKLIDSYPYDITVEVLQRGQQEYDIYCSPCHDYTGSGNGMVVQRGFSAPPSFHSQGLVSQPPGFFVNVIQNGFGRMYAYDDRVDPADRWAIAAYIKALQLSQNAPKNLIPSNDLQNLPE